MGATAEDLGAPGATVDRTQAEQFARLLFDGMSGFVNLRAIEEPAPKGRKGKVRDYWLPIDANLPHAMGDYVEACDREGLAAYVLPAAVMEHEGGLNGLLSVRVLPFDFDSGDCDGKIRTMTAALGTPWFVIRSGGRNEQGHATAHAYYRLADDIQRSDTDAYRHLAALRAAAAAQFGADPKVGSNPAQILRVPGSAHKKGEPRPCHFVGEVRNSRVTLDSVAAAIGAAAPPAAPSNVVSFDFNNVRLSADVAALRDMETVQTGGASGIVRYDWFNHVAGAEIADVRGGRKTLEDAREYVRGKVAGKFENAESDWLDSGKFDREFDALVRVDAEKHGPIMPPAPVLAGQAAGLRLSDWYTHRRFVGEAPARRWLVSDMIPLGTPGVFAAVGDAGKSMLALKLANVVANYPAPHNGPLGPIDTPSFFGRPIVGRGAALVLTGEDDADEIHRRLNAIAPERVKSEAESRLIVCPLLSAGGARAFIRDSKNGPEFTPFWHEVREQIEQIPDLAFVVFDPLTLFVGGDTSDNAIGAALMGEMNALAAKTGAAVMIVHHFAKGARISGLADARGAVLGAGAWVNNGRWGVVMWEAEQGEANSVLRKLGQAERARQTGVVYFGGLTKSNAPGAKEQRTLVRGSAGVLEDVTDAIRAATPKEAEVDEMLYRGLLEMKAADPHFSFTGGKGALWAAWEVVVRKHDLPITKDGSGKTADVQSVFTRLRNAEKLKQVQGEKGRAPRFEPV